MTFNVVRALCGAALLGCFSAAASAAVIASVPVIGAIVPGAGGSDFSADISLPADVATAMVGYDVAFSITGPTAGLTITGIDTRPANSVFASDPTFSTHVVGGTTVYAFSDFLLSGNGTIATGSPGSTLFRLKFHAAAGTTGVFAVNFITDAASAYKSVLYANASLTAVPTTFQAGSVTFAAAVPEPASVGFLGMGGVMLLRRRRRV